jgi:NitT/TauT family transport system substrate-binding protein
MDRGLDKKYGIQFVETSYVSSTAMLDALAAGSLDVGIGVGTISLFSAVQNGLIPNKVVVGAAMSFSDPAHPFTAVLVAPSINSWQDLKGKQIGVPALYGPPAAGIKGRLRLEGISDYTLVEIALPNLGLSVAGGNIAAVVVPETYLTQSLLRKDGKLLGWVIGGPPFEKVEYTMVVASANLVKSNPEAVKSYLRAHLQAVKWLSQNNDEASAILAKRPTIVQAVLDNEPERVQSELSEFAQTQTAPHWVLRRS